MNLWICLHDSFLLFLYLESLNFIHKLFYLLFNSEEEASLITDLKGTANIAQSCKRNNYILKKSF